ncbi:MAG: carboxymuconolactone decarboxylase family protein [Xanthomonadales bacterium]|nr:carboxymuconolactone decarboxylase family protein [Xanthomonadales bacterium]
MAHDYPDLLADLNRDIAALRNALPRTMQAFSGLARSASEAGDLDPKLKELLAVGIAIAIRCDGCIGFHVKAAMGAGASRQEILETIGMAIYMGAGPSMLYGAEALRAADELALAAETA